MKYLKLTLAFILIFSCSKKVKDDVSFDGAFAGARLDSITKIGNNEFIAHISPAFEPVNKSPYYAFSVQSQQKKTIVVQLDYGVYKHRYIPKLSYDKKRWKPIDDKNIDLDTLKGTATLQLEVSKQKLFVAAQEIETSADTYRWMDSLMDKIPNLKNVVAVKTVKNNNNYCIEFENPENKKSIVLVARQHPPEIPGGTIGFKAFFEELFTNSKEAIKFRSQFNINAFPLLNPDGADMGNWRHNANGKDLNRDWITFSQPETKMVKSYLERKTKAGNSIVFGIDFHTSHSGPYLLVLDSINEAKTSGIIPKWIENIESNASFKVDARRRSQELPYCYNYFFNELGAEAVTYEDGDEIDREVIKKRAKLYARELMKTMNVMHDIDEK